MNMNKITLILISLLVFIVAMGCLNATNLDNVTADNQSDDGPHTLEGTLGGGPEGGLGSTLGGGSIGGLGDSKPASPLGSTLGGGSIGGLGSSKPASPLGSTLGGGSIGGLGSSPNPAFEDFPWIPVIDPDYDNPSDNALQ